LTIPLIESIGYNLEDKHGASFNEQLQQLLVLSKVYGTVKITKQVYVSYFGTNGAATYGGYYSGFDTKPA
jgi:hypothetical protein